MSRIKVHFSVCDAKLLCAIKDCREPKKIADFMEIAPSSINVLMQRIEKKAKKKLFIRKQNPNIIQLNEDGLDLYFSCRKIWEGSDDVDEKLWGKSSNGIEGEVKLTATQTILEYFYAPYLVRFMKKYPMLMVAIRQLDDIFSIDQDVNEFYFTTEIEDDTETYAYFPYHSFAQKLWASEKYINTFGKVESIEDLYRHNLLFQRGSINTDQILGIPQVKATLSYNSNMIRMLNITGSRIIDKLCEEGLGIMAGSKETKELSKLNIEPVLPNFTADVVNLYVKVNKSILTKSVGKFFLDWVFKCRDLALKKAGTTPSYEYKKMLNIESAEDKTLEQEDEQTESSPQTPKITDTKNKQ